MGIGSDDAGIESWLCDLEVIGLTFDINHHLKDGRTTIPIPHRDV